MNSLSLSGLGLTGRHILAVVDGLSTPGNTFGCLYLDCNPGITAQGYGALFNLVHWNNAYNGCNSWYGLRVYNKAWQRKLNLVIKVNLRYNRLEYLTNGSFSSEERRWKLQEWVMNLPSDRSYDEEDSSYDEGGAIEDEAVFNDEDEEDRSYDEEDSSYDEGGAIEDEAVFNDEDEEDRSYDEEVSSYDGGGAIEDEAAINDEDEQDRSYDDEDSSYDWGGAIEDEAVRRRERDDATRIDFIWCLLRENPDMMRTSYDMFQIL
jgi:hypothetical protein